jgi:hypothetical protein
MYRHLVNHITAESTATIRAALLDCHTHGTPAIITFTSEGEDCGVLAEVADTGPEVVTLFPFQAGMLVAVAWRAITSVEAWTGGIA